jgi:hypothetical protein
LLKFSISANNKEIKVFYFIQSVQKAFCRILLDFSSQRVIDRDPLSDNATRQRKGMGGRG